MPRRGRSGIRGVYEEPIGAGVYWIRYQDATGKRVREKIGSRALAESVLAKRKAAIAAGGHFPTGVGLPTVERAITDYLKRKVDKASYGEMKRHARYWIAAHGDLRLDRVTAQMLEEYAARRRRKVARQTVHHELKFLRSVYRASRATFPLVLRQPKNQRGRYLTEIEEARLMRQLKPADQPMVRFAMLTGLRQAEQFGLRWQDVQWESETLRIPRTKDGGPRVVHLTDGALAILRALPRRLRCKWVFPNRRGKAPLNIDNWLRRSFRPALEAAEVDDFRWNDLRHTFASRLVMAGADLVAVQQLMGHASLDMTMRYAHLAPGHLGRTVKLLNGKRGIVGPRDGQKAQTGGANHD